MSFTSWSKLEALFQAAMELPRGERESFVTRQPLGDDAALELRALLQAADDVDDDFLESSLLDSLTPQDSDSAGVSRPAHPIGGTTIGHYHIVRLLGRGGMGIVYEARDDKGRRVALKVLAGAGLHDPRQLRRFRRESANLMRVSHPSIAAIFEAGRTDRGVDYIAMELVEGRSLDAHVRHEAPPLRERLRLFVEICGAVQFAHERGVVHRDLKPKNIMVVTATEEPTVKVLDFGLALVLGENTSLTGSGHMLGTLRYMSPEQASARHGRVGVGSDVYSLGVILYELLTDRLPYELDRERLPESVRILCEVRPLPPGALDRRLQGNLDTILGKALEKQAARRYASVRELGADVERHLAGRPILACPPGRIERFTELVARHKLVSAFICALALVLFASSLGLGALYVEAREAERVARFETETAREINAFLEDVLAMADPLLAGQPDLTVSRAVTHAARRIDTVFHDRPLVAAGLRETIGNAYRGLGQLDAAETHLHGALTTRRALLGPRHERVADSLASLGLLRISQGAYSDARTLLEEAVDIRRSLAAEGPALADLLGQLAFAIRKDGVDPGRFEAAERFHEEALSLLTSSGAGGAKIAAAQSDLARMMVERGDDVAAIDLYQESLRTFSDLFGAESLEVAVERNDLAIVLARHGRMDEAEELYRQALATLRTRLGREHPSTVIMLDTFGDFCTRRGDLDEAQELLESALAMRERNLPPGHPDLAVTLNHMGHLERARGRLTASAEMYERALDINRVHYGDQHQEVADTTLGLAEVAAQSRDFVEAVELAEDALQVFSGTLPDNHWKIGATQDLLGGYLAALGMYAEAEAVLIEATRILSLQCGDANQLTAKARRHLDNVRRRLAAASD